MNSNKINNSYETESSSSSNSLISAECLFNATSFNNNGENSLNSIFGISNYKDDNFLITDHCTEYSDELDDNYTNKTEENYNLDTFKNLENNLYKKDNYMSSLESEIISDQDVRFKTDVKILLKNEENIFVNENSSNAVDNALIMTDKINIDHSLTFDNLIKNIVNQKTSTVMIDITKNINCNNSISNYSKKSPNLFDDETLDNEVPTNNNETFNNIIESKSSVNDNVINIYENSLLKLIKSKLSGVLPPPSVTTTQYDISTMLSLYLKNVDNTNNFENNVTNYVYKQTHNLDEAKSIAWPECLKAKSHGLCFNYSIESENIELLCLKYCERYIGTETASSYSFSSNNICSPSSTKKRAMRMKILGQSPGRRLSHLARRRQFFNSITSVQSKSSSNLNLHSSNRQILVSTNSGKNKSRSSISDVKIFNTKQPLLNGPLSAGPSRETSKRALFQSPPKNNRTFSITPELADRVGKSKRVLFSPSKNILEQFPALNNNTNGDKSLITRANSTSCLDVNLKMGSNKRPSIDIIENKNKVRCTDFNSVLKTDDDSDETFKNSLKLARSQSFCASENEVKLSNARSTRTIFRTSSDIVTSKSTTSTPPFNQILSDSHKKKLLWAVSQALQSKNIKVTNENFKMYATTLARITKRLYIEDVTENSSNTSSTSEKMLKLANRLAFYVIQGKTVDDIYQMEQKRSERIKLQKSFLNNKELGYITENDYNLLKNKINIDLNLSQSSSNELDNNKQNHEMHNANSKLILRENVDFDKKPKSTQKHNVQAIFSGKDQKNIQIISPLKSAKKIPTSTINKYSLKKFHIENNNLGNLNVLKAKRQISFDM